MIVRSSYARESDASLLPLYLELLKLGAAIFIQVAGQYSVGIVQEIVIATLKSVTKNRSDQVRSCSRFRQLCATRRTQSRPLRGPSMPPKYSHVKKRTSGNLPGSSTKKGSNNSSGNNSGQQNGKKPNPHADRNITKAISAVSYLERAIARILLIRYEQDMARLFSTHLYCVALCHLPTFVMRCITLGGPGWVAANADGEEIKDFFRATIAMDLRQAGERVATKSVLWSYTALRHFVRPVSALNGFLANLNASRRCPTTSRSVIDADYTLYDYYRTILR